MRITEGQLRRIIREELLESAESQAAFKKAAWDRVSIYGEPTDDMEDQDPYSYSARRADPARLSSERELKRIWRELADHEFFDDKLLKLHSMSFMGDAGRDSEKVLKFLRSWLRGPNKDELSCMGIRPEDVRPGWFMQERLSVGIFVDGWVTYAGVGGLDTEWTQRATKADKQRHAQSGLPKRPFLMGPNTLVGAGKTGPSYDHLKYIVLDEEDWIERVGSENHEIIIDNWTPKAFVLSQRLVNSSGIDGIRETFGEVIDLCRKKDLPIVDETNRPIEGI
jgi:hypothetical protein